MITVHSGKSMLVSPTLLMQMTLTLGVVLNWVKIDNLSFSGVSP
jgi:hypothetical protein